MLTLQVDKPRHTEVTVIQPGFLDSQGCALQGDFLPPTAVSTRRAWAPRCTPPCPAWESPRAENSGDALHGIPLTRLPGPLTSREHPRVAWRGLRCRLRVLGGFPPYPLWGVRLLVTQPEEEQPPKSVPKEDTPSLQPGLRPGAPATTQSCEGRHWVPGHRHTLL